MHVYMWHGYCWQNVYSERKTEAKVNLVSVIFKSIKIRKSSEISTKFNTKTLCLYRYRFFWCQKSLKTLQLINRTRIAERRFLTGLQRGYFFWGEGAAIHTQATIKPCRQPLHATESHVRLKHKLIHNIVPFVTKKKSTIFKWGLNNNF